MFIPAFRGVSCLMGEDGKGIAGLTNPRGFVVINEFQGNPTFKNVFAVGVCVAIPPYEQTPVPVGVPKTGYMIESMVSVVSRTSAILWPDASRIASRPETPSASPTSATAASPSWRCRRSRRARSTGPDRAIGCIWRRCLREVLPAQGAQGNERTRL